MVYCVIGGTGVTLDFLIYSTLIWGLDLAYQFANAVGYASGTVLSFFLNAWFNFRTTDRVVLRFFSFCTAALLGYGASACTLYLLVTVAGLDKYLSKLATIVVVVLVQYNFNRLISFRKMPPLSNG